MRCGYLVPRSFFYLGLFLALSLWVTFPCLEATWLTAELNIFSLCWYRLCIMDHAYCNADWKRSCHIKSAWCHSNCCKSIPSLAAFSYLCLSVGRECNQESRQCRVHSVCERWATEHSMNYRSNSSVLCRVSTLVHTQSFYFDCVYVTFAATFRPNGIAIFSLIEHFFPTVWTLKQW